QTIKNAEQLTAALDIIPSDAIFEAVFSEVRIAQDFIARYLLRALEMEAKGDTEPENIPNDEENVINVEHILPEHTANNWPGIEADQRATGETCEIGCPDVADFLATRN